MILDDIFSLMPYVHLSIFDCVDKTKQYMVTRNLDELGITYQKKCKRMKKATVVSIIPTQANYANVYIERNW